MAQDSGRQTPRPRRAEHRAGRASRASRRSAEVSPDEGISTIRSGQGARVTTRKNAAEAAGRARKNAEKRYFERHPEARAPQGGPERNGKNVVLLVIASVLVLATVFVIGSCVSGMLSPSPGQGSDQPDQTLKLTEQEQQIRDQQQAHDAGREQVEVGGSVTFNGDSYALAQQDDGTWSLVRTSSSGTETTLFLIEGEPVALARMSSTLLVPENRNGRWDVVCYVIDGHSDAGYVTTPDGALAGGEGDATSVELRETSIVVTDSSGASHEVSLV